MKYLEYIVAQKLSWRTRNFLFTACTLVPIIKDKLGDSCSSKSYRSIAISSLGLKIFDWVILLLYGAWLVLDHLQFAYQPGRSTTICFRAQLLHKEQLTCIHLSIFLRYVRSIWPCYALSPLQEAVKIRILISGGMVCVQNTFWWQMEWSKGQFWVLFSTTYIWMCCLGAIHK